MRGMLAWPLVLGVCVGGGCAGSGDQAKVDAAIARLRSGAVVRQMNADAVALQSEPATAASPKAPASAPAVTDPCTTPKPKVGAPDVTEEVLKDAMTQLGDCLMAQTHDGEVWDSAIAYMKLYRLEDGEKPLSSRPVDEVMAFLKQYGQHPVKAEIAGSKRKELIRSSFSDDDLDEIVKLAQLKHDAMALAEKRIFAAMDARRTLVAHFAKTIDRYALLEALRNTADDADGTQTAQMLSSLVSDAGGPVPQKLDSFPVALLHPYAIEAAVPGKGDELAGLNFAGENPFDMVLNAVGDLGGPEDSVKGTRHLYSILRSKDNPDLPDHDLPAADAAHVAFIDTGADFVRYPELGLFLGLGRDGEVASHDYEDNDNNPWMVGLSEFGHGSGTMGTLLSIVAHEAPELLTSRKIDVAMWKVSTIRELLAGDAETKAQTWYSRIGVNDAIASNILAANPGDSSLMGVPAEGPRYQDGSKTPPKIVSISMSFGTQPFLDLEKAPDLIKHAPWLWVMAAGNSGEDVDAKDASGPSSCFSDVPADQRDDSKILCVGALIRGIVNDKIASYSNYGDRVDVYGYESYLDLCPNGTSCSTPAVASAAAIIAAKYPALGAAQIKQAIVNAAEERLLDVQPEYSDVPVTGPAVTIGDGITLPIEQRKVKVFDPTSMLGKALSEAAKLAAPAPAPDPSASPMPSPSLAAAS